MCGCVFDRDVAIPEDSAEETFSIGDTDADSAENDVDDSLTTGDLDDEEASDSDDNILSAKAEEVVTDNADFIDDVERKYAKASVGIEKHRLKEAISFLREQLINRLLKVAYLTNRWDNDDHFHVWYGQAQDLMGKQSLNLDTAMLIMLNKNKEILRRQLREAIQNVHKRFISGRRGSA